MEFLHDTMRLMGWTALIGLPAAAWLGSLRLAMGLAAGMGWAMANAWVMGRLIGQLMSDTRPRRVTRVAWWMLKLPVLYGVAGVLIVSPWSSAIGFVMGFSLWPVLLVVSVLRRAGA